MRLLGISVYEQANQYLPAFILDYNRFAVMPASASTSIVRMQPWISNFLLYP